MSSPTITKQYKREEYVYLAKLYEKAERFDDMVVFINKFVAMQPCLTQEERNILSAGYKNVISNRRASWRLLNNLEKKEGMKSQQLQYLKEIKGNIENEMIKTCDVIQEVIDKYGIPKADNAENLVFFLKLKGDYYRYRAEFAVGNDFDDATGFAEKAYKEAYDVAEKQLPIANSIRGGLALNFSVFYYEIKGLKEEAADIAKTSFDEAMKVGDDGEKSKSKDTGGIIQLLKENLILWSNEMNEEDPNN